VAGVDRAVRRASGRLGREGSAERELAERAYATLREGGIDVVYDDRDAGPGEKFADAELLGAPLRLTVGRRSLESGEIEVQLRRGRESLPGIAPDELLERVEELCRGLP
jgi:prolyl-tRNA synthetase